MSKSTFVGPTFVGMSAALAIIALGTTQASACDCGRRGYGYYPPPGYGYGPPPAYGYAPQVYGNPPQVYGYYAPQVYGYYPARGYGYYPPRAYGYAPPPVYGGPRVYGYSSSSYFYAGAVDNNAYDYVYRPYGSWVPAR